jgi:[protein-PII] uridylyltransferase
VDIQAVDRIGLLYTVFSTIGSLGLEITHARINTEKGAAIDSFRVTDSGGRKLTSLAEVNRLREALERAIGVPGAE